MGVIHKFGPEIIDFILENKKKSPGLSCRKLTGLIKENFQLDASKSSINKVLKNAGLSMPVGRRKTKPLLLGQIPSQELPQEVRCLKITFSNANQAWLDGQMHSLWPSPNLPYAFSAALGEIKNCLLRCFDNNQPLVLFMAAGYAAPTKEFFGFLSGLDLSDNKILEIALCNRDLKELEIIHPRFETARNYLFGTWPWQFTASSKIKHTGQFNLYKHPVTQEELSLADIEIELTQPDTDKTLSLRGCSLKKISDGKTRLVVLGNLPAGTPAQEIADLYLSRWPDIEKELRDYSKKIIPGDGSA